ncbi:hypothetical protein M0802_002482 [Mischocyttarus mexicanus]|nr:hypothetical protein M0802_002482 [Mischocyttarus mexicanus]
MPKSGSKWRFWRKPKRAAVEQKKEEKEESNKGKRKHEEEEDKDTIIRKKPETTSSSQDCKRKTMENMLPKCDARLPKMSLITDDYEISNHVLGLGINGKVVQCYDRKTREKYALKLIKVYF